MTETYPFKPGDRIMDEGEDAQVSDYKHTAISYHTFCPRGRVCSS